MLKLGDSVTYLKGVGERRAKSFEKLGIKTVYDLLYHFPRSYAEFSSPVAIKDVVSDEVNIISGKIAKKMRPAFIKKGMTVYKAIFTDDESDVTIIIYNSEYLFDQLKEGESYVLMGKVTGNLLRKEISSPSVLPIDSSKIQPIYSLTEGLTQNVVKNAQKNALRVFDDAVIEPVPKWILQEYNLSTLRFALENMHFPIDNAVLEMAKRRLVFDELLVLQLGMSMLRSENNTLTGSVMKLADLKEFFDCLPFELTNAQQNAISDCTADMCRLSPMNRLIQGDVGSGKTAVAAACCYFAHKNGRQSALMAPTEILAGQHYLTLKKFLEPCGISVCLLTGSLTPKQKTQLKKRIFCRCRHSCTCAKIN